MSEQEKTADQELGIDDETMAAEAEARAEEEAEARAEEEAEAEQIAQRRNSSMAKICPSIIEFFKEGEYEDGVCFNSDCGARPDYAVDIIMCILCHCTCSQYEVMGILEEAKLRWNKLIDEADDEAEADDEDDESGCTFITLDKEAAKAYAAKLKAIGILPGELTAEAAKFISKIEAAVEAEAEMDAE